MVKDDCGAIWVKTSRKGDEYLSLTVNGEYYVAFKNEYKKKDSQPDWRILPSEPMRGGAKSADSNKDQASDRSPIPDDDIPF